MDWSARLFGLSGSFLNTTGVGGGVLQVRCSYHLIDDDLCWQHSDQVLADYGIGLMSRRSCGCSSSLHAAAPYS
jgi:hypothetical protein